MTPVTITVTVTEAGQIQVTGPLHDKATCYALLECAKDVVRSQAQPVVVPAAPADVISLAARRA